MLGQSCSTTAQVFKVLSLLSVNVLLSKTVQPHPGILIRDHAAGFIPQSLSKSLSKAAVSPTATTKQQLLLGQVSARAGGELLAGAAVDMTTKQVTLKKLQAGSEPLHPAGDDTPSHYRLTTCWGFGMPQSSWLVLL